MRKVTKNDAMLAVSALLSRKDEFLLDDFIRLVKENGLVFGDEHELRQTGERQLARNCLNRIRFGGKKALCSVRRRRLSEQGELFPEYSYKLAAQVQPNSLDFDSAVSLLVSKVLGIIRRSRLFDDQLLYDISVAFERWRHRRVA